MNFRYLYIALVIAFAYMLFLSWGQDSERKKELVEAAYIEQIEIDEENPPGAVSYTHLTLPTIYSV